jgi:hypothetical protein
LLIYFDNALVACEFILLVIPCPVKVSFIATVQDVQVHVPAYQANSTFESDTPNLRVKAQALTIRFPDVVDITSLSFAIVGSFWVREAPAEWGCTPNKRRADVVHRRLVIDANQGLWVEGALHWQSKKGWITVKNNVADEVCAVIIQDGYGGGVFVIFIVSRVLKNLLTTSLNQMFPSEALRRTVGTSIGHIEAGRS